MGTQSGVGLDAWLREGGLVVTSSDRAARAIQSEFHRLRRIDGLSAWRTPNVLDWMTFARTQWEVRNLDGLLLLNQAQEQALWSEIIHSEQDLSTAVPASIRRLSAMAMQAYDLVCSYAPKYLRDSARVSWDKDAGRFSQWLSEFEEHCRRNKLISASRVPLDLILLLKNDPSPRPPLCLAGFDRLLLKQRDIFDAWGTWQQSQTDCRATQPVFFSARNSQAELEACAFWCNERINQNPDTRLLVITQDLSQRRGEIERAFLGFSPPTALPRFEFSLGVPLKQVPLARSALVLLRWLTGAIDESDLDWLFASGFARRSDESAALQACMRILRRSDLQRVQWTLDAFLNQSRIASELPPLWRRRMQTAALRLKDAAQILNPVDWADKIPQVLEATGWTVSQPQTSASFQALRRWQQALDTAGSLGFDGRTILFSDFLVELEHAVEEILFAPQSVDAPIQIAGPAVSAGLTADAIWFLGADEASWPADANMHPLLPAYVQREAAMPHASHLLDWEFATAITNRLLTSAPIVHFSYAIQKEDLEMRPSRLVSQIVGVPQPLSSNLIPPAHEPAASIEFIDSTTVPFPLAHLHGGSFVLTSQSQCPFKAFATARLAAEGWDAAEPGLSPKRRGQLLHAILHTIWSGEPDGIKNHADLLKITDLPAFVRTHVQRAMAQHVPSAVRLQMPPAYLQLEEVRLVRLISEWLEFESNRIPFTVEKTEADCAVTIEGLSMNLRLDRVDRLIDSSLLVVDYKTGNVSPNSWDLPRPDDVQLPLYKIFGVTLDATSHTAQIDRAKGGLVFAKVRTGQTLFAGRVVKARETIDSTLNGNNSLVKRKLTTNDEAEWEEYIRRLVQDFLHGRADVDPRDYPMTCEHCGLQAVCRIQEPENRAQPGDEDETEEDVAVEE